MDVKGFLKSLKDLNKQIQAKEERLSQLMQAVPLTGGTGQSERVQTSPKKEATYCTMVEEIVIIEGLISIYEMQRKGYIRLIESLESKKYVEVLKLCHVEGLRLYEVADIMGYSYEHTRHIHRAAIDELAEILES
jgi:hypothetical protein